MSKYPFDQTSDLPSQTQGSSDDQDQTFVGFLTPLQGFDELDDLDEDDVEDSDESEVYPDKDYFIRMAGKKPITLGEIDNVLSRLKYTHHYYTYEWDCEDLRMSYPCCQSCGIYEIAQHIENEDLGEEFEPKKYVFFNVQSFDSSFEKDGTLVRPLYLAWGEIDPEIVRAEFAAVGIKLVGGEDRSQALCIEGRL
jgi:hypothetical protein